MTYWQDIYLNKWATLSFILLFATISVYDSIVVKLSSIAGTELSKNSNVIIFVIFFTFYGISTRFLLISSREDKKNRHKRSFVDKFHIRGILITALILTFTITLTIIFQITFQGKYNLTLLELQTAISRLSGLALLTPLIYLFASWSISKKVT